MKNKTTTNNSRFIKSAFTLAETLIVIGIIGVVAALTLPNLNHATGDKERVTRVKKAYSGLTEAFDRAQAIYGDYDTWEEHNCSTVVCKARRITEFMKISKDCGIDANKGCFKSGYVKFQHNGQNWTTIDDQSYIYKVMTADGMSIAFWPNGDASVDIDGPNRGKFTMGYDYFNFKIANNMINLPCTGLIYTFSQLKNYVNKSADGSCSTYWIINYDNMDYLHFDDDGNCDNGNVVTESNPSCN